MFSRPACSKLMSQYGNKGSLKALTSRPFYCPAVSADTEITVEVDITITRHI